MGNTEAKMKTDYVSTGIVYCILNKQNEKRYVGSTVGLYHRKNDHLHRLRNGKHYSELMQKDFNEWGEDSFVIFVLEEVKTNDRDLLFSREQYWIDKYHPEYNVSKYAGHYLCLTKDSHKKSADARRGRKQSQEEKDRRADSIKKFWATHPAKIIPQEMREHLSKINTGKKNPNWGLKRTPEQLQRQSDGRANTIYTFKSPEGDTISFRKITNSPTPLSYSTLRKLVRGILKESMGWTFVKKELVRKS